MNKHSEICYRSVSSSVLIRRPFEHVKFCYYFFLYIRLAGKLPVTMGFVEYPSVLFTNLCRVKKNVLFSTVTAYRHSVNTVRGNHLKLIREFPGGSRTNGKATKLFVFFFCRNTNEHIHAYYYMPTVKRKHVLAVVHLLQYSYSVFVMRFTSCRYLIKTFGNICLQIRFNRLWTVVDLGLYFVFFFFRKERKSCSKDHWVWIEIIKNIYNSKKL